VAFASSSLAWPDSAEAQRRAPNILIFVTDDQRATETLSVMPRTRRYFRRQGTQYTNAFATTPLCCPSRTTILTGRYAHNTGVRRNNEARGLDRTTLFPRVLRRSGYRTALVGKFLNGWGSRPPYFDLWAMRRGGNLYEDPTFNVNGRVRRLAGYSTDLIGSYARAFLRRFELEDRSPWFLYVAPMAPHWPWTPAARHRHAPLSVWPGNPAVFEADRSDKPRFVRSIFYTLEDARAVRAGQLRTLMSVDDMIARVFRVLARLNEKRNTLAIFTSDNGFLWADHHLGGAHSTAGAKRFPYTASVQVPFLVRWPGHVAPGAKSHRLTGLVDIAPTVLAAARVARDPTKPPLDGRSLFAPGRRVRLLLEYWRGQNEDAVPTWASLRTKRYQYIEYYRPDGRRSFREYYDLVRDPWQLRNLLHDGNPGNNPNLRSLRDRLARDRRCAGRGAVERPCP
jgi:arylsulfatase A-like enzyme